jgi:hypothetical protein
MCFSGYMNIMWRMDIIEECCYNDTTIAERRCLMCPSDAARHLHDKRGFGTDRADEMKFCDECLTVPV